MLVGLLFLCVVPRLDARYCRETVCHILSGIIFSSCTIRTDDDSAALTECGGDRLVAFIIVVTHEVDSFLCAHVGVCMCVCMCVSVCVIHSLHWRHQS